MMKPILCILLVILLCFSFIGCKSNELVGMFESLEVETTENIPYVRYKEVVLENTTIDCKKILEENNADWSFLEVYVVQGDTIWFGFQNSENKLKKWNIASINSDGKEFSIRYSGTFCVGDGADKTYDQNNNNPSNGVYQHDNGFYYDGKIVLTDGVKTVEYDLKTNVSTEFAATDYEYPMYEIKAEILDYHTISFYKGNEEKIFDVERGKQTSKVFAKLYNELEPKKNWDDIGYLSYLFDKVQIVDDQIYVFCRVINCMGETHAIVFRYDYETNSIQHAFNYFMGDVIINRLYVVPKG
ncbi:MAG: hypothetical protein IKU25_07455 [Clostridia bacterium]|nr:hypothetical protein [Clostridia bacterium]